MMSFTNRLGTIDSQLGNIVLGNIVGNILHERTISQILVITHNNDFDYISSTPINENQRCVDDILNLSETISFDKSKAFSITVTDFLNLQQPCIVNQTTHLPKILSRTINQTLDLTDRVSNATSFDLSDTLTFNEDVTYTFGDVFSESVDDLIVFNETIQTPVVADQTITDIFAITEDITYTFKVFNTASITDTLEFTEDITEAFTKEQTIVDSSLTFTETLSIFKIFKFRLKDTLALADDLNSSTILSRSFSDQLVFKDNYEYPLSYATIINIPTVSYVHIPKAAKKYILLSAKNGLIQLPAPFFDDAHSATNDLQIGRSMNGRVYSFVKRSKTKKLTYNFSLSRRKAQELGTFYLNNCHQQISMINHNGDKYIGFITSEPFSIVEDRAYDNKVELTFEGINL